MKKILGGLYVCSLFLIGCQEDSSILEPSVHSSQYTGEDVRKVKSIELYEDEDKINIADDKPVPEKLSRYGWTRITK